MGRGPLRYYHQHGWKRLSVIPVLAHAAEAVAAKSAGLDAVCYLRATSPFVRPSSVQRAVLELLARARCSGVHDSPDPFVPSSASCGNGCTPRFKRIDSDSGDFLTRSQSFLRVGSHGGQRPSTRFKGTVP